MIREEKSIARKLMKREVRKRKGREGKPVDKRGEEGKGRGKGEEKVKESMRRESKEKKR